VGLASEFDTLLANFLEHRNTLVHDLQCVEGHTFSSYAGLQQMNEYALLACSEAMRVTEIFIAFIDAWSEQIFDRLRAEHPDVYDSTFLTNIRETITPFLNDFVYDKPNA
jgi:hypothetical protein